jgi:hypothetical protein|nr:MAG TPA: hypothetical protein [Caudoviricetes sp.]
MASAVSHRVFKESGYIFFRKHNDAKAYPAPANIQNPTAEEAAAIEAYLKELAAPEFWIGLLKGGYSFASTITALSDQDDMGILKVDDVQDEKATSTFSLFNPNTKVIEQVYPMSKYGESADGKLKIASLGGIANKKDEAYDVLFVHPDTAEGDICIYSIGKNISGLTIDFKPGAVTPLPCSYASQTLNSTGVLAYVTEHDKAVRIFTPPADNTDAELTG